MINQTLKLLNKLEKVDDVYNEEDLNFQGLYENENINLPDGLEEPLQYSPNLMDTSMPDLDIIDVEHGFVESYHEPVNIRCEEEKIEILNNERAKLAQFMNYLKSIDQGTTILFSNITSKARRLTAAKAFFRYELFINFLRAYAYTSLLQLASFEMVHIRQVEDDISITLL